ncbi:unnamed protein product [Pseudo-nitzschia multistriata]|uniref:GAT domain-containing protein n=1 Tax=Pseudo-nitzschia multistriata TaxID=183589 RepID=A0A448ZQH1_9STRA|nr:unnamed protein product [Pseudo-nitzschia multistriata]
MATPAVSGGTTTSEADAKISRDLAVLAEKMDLLEGMLLKPSEPAAPRPSVRTNEAVRALVGYLDACGPRMIELVTVCTTSPVFAGVLGEEVFGEVLASNDRLQKILSDVDTLAMTETAASTTAASAGGASGKSLGEDGDGNGDLGITDQFDDLFLSSEDAFAEAHGNTTHRSGAAGAKTTGEEDEGGDTKPAAKPAATAERDPFDDFFAERTEASNF